MKKWSVFTLIALRGISLFAFETTQVLPVGVNSPQVSYSWVENLDQRFNSSQNLIFLKDQYTFAFDINSLERLESDVTELRAALNAVSNQNLGDKLHLGYLSIDSSPSISYWVLSHAWGLTPQWTVGFGAPVVNYKNKITISQNGSNLDFYKQNVVGLSAELDSAIRRLDTNLALEASQVLAEKGYKPVESINSSFLGDSQIVSIYKVKELQRFSILHKGAVNLPTGPKDNPNDLTDLGLFGQFYFQNALIAVYNYGAWSPAISASHKYFVQDTVQARVPRSASDFLPDAASLQSVKRKIGDVFELTLQSGYQLSKKWELLALISESTQEKSNYSGGAGGEYRYDLLGADTASRKLSWSIGASFSSVFDYLKSKKNIPLIGSLNYSDVFNGTNSPRQTKTEMGLTLFY